jgi:hypothetical protein
MCSHCNGLEKIGSTLLGAKKMSLLEKKKASRGDLLASG